MSRKRAKYVFVTGGVLSSIGKGITTAAIGTLLKSHGLSVTALKLDPYLNVDAGTMSPFQHGEVFVTDDGAETDLDLGHYERFLGVRMGAKNNVTAGKVYAAVIAKERRGDFLGATVQIVPHVIEEIKSQIAALENGIDVILVEVGGTVGDIESQPFLEAIRQMALERRGDAVFVHLTLVPYLSTVQELKTKPTQHSVQELRRIGIQPDFIFARSPVPLSDSARAKVALFSNVDAASVISLPDVKSIYQIPPLLAAGGVDRQLLERLRPEKAEKTPKPPAKSAAPLMERWERLAKTVLLAKDAVTIAMVGKYIDLQDAYKSILEALTHAAAAHDRRLDLRWVDAEELQDRTLGETFKGVGGILVPGGFGERGIEGKVRAVSYARLKSVPYLGLCLGLQIAVIEYARNVLGLDGATSTEFSPRPRHPVIDLMEEQKKKKNLGGTMRLGACTCNIRKGTLAHRIYGQPKIRERHRHRYEVNAAYVQRLAKAGLVAAGTDERTGLVEIVECPSHPFFIGVQFHPEFLSAPLAPHPLFKAFVGAALR
ncbi:MAG: CTP synthase [Candidatus Lindowbacteria bacterium RIFCSPLOWO2_12_FULL_62_27]|nr:MAG: CTP synthase [Candidatus Lindowbacteria bacterium RIFCSPLOWO2_12_FULL_62_27]OGH63765.1 MAG: CTP synthase [Candidatus Lindowbacteria bacterium RIFCSPLOWO2_02_FULL_62_12]